MSESKFYLLRYFIYAFIFICLIATFLFASKIKLLNRFKTHIVIFVISGLLVFVVFSTYNIFTKTDETSMVYQEELYGIKELDGQEFNSKWQNLNLGLNKLLGNNINAQQEFERILLVLNKSKQVKNYQLSYYNRTDKEYMKVVVNQISKEIFFSNTKLKSNLPQSSRFTVDSVMNILDDINLNLYINKLNSGGDITIFVYSNLYKEAVLNQNPANMWVIVDGKVSTDLSIVKESAEVLVVNIQNKVGNSNKDISIIWAEE